LSSAEAAIPRYAGILALFLACLSVLARADTVIRGFVISFVVLARTILFAAALDFLPLGLRRIDHFPQCIPPTK
jgi:hypothetical protein